MKVRANDFGRQWAEIGTEVLAATEAVGAGGRYILGERVAAFEAKLAAAWPAPFAVGVGNGLDALEIGLRCLGVAAGERVLTTPLSAFASTLAIVRAGGTPVFVDVDRRGLIDLDRCRDLLRRDRGIRRLLVVHLYGQALDLDAVESLGDELELEIVEDCAQSIGATWRGRATGSVGGAAATSFYPTKNLGALGDGGAVLTGSEDVAARARALRHYGQSATYAHDHLGLNSRLDELHAAVLGEVLLPRLPDWTRRRRRHAARLRAGIANPAIELPSVPADCDPCWHLFPVVVAAGERADFVRHLAGAGIECGQHYPRLIPEQRALAEVPFEVAGELDNARRFAAGEVSLPLHPFLDDAEVDHVVAACNRWSRA